MNNIFSVFQKGDLIEFGHLLSTGWKCQWSAIYLEDGKMHALDRKPTDYTYMSGPYPEDTVVKTEKGWRVERNKQY